MWSEHPHTPADLRRLLWRGRLAVAAFLLLTVVGLVVVAAVMRHVSTRLDALDLGARENTTWLFSQLENEGLRLRVALSDALLARDGGEGEAGALDALRLAVDLFASRIDLLDAPVAAPLVADLAPAVGLRDDLDALIALADRSLGAARPAATDLLAVREHLDSLLPRLRVLAVEAVHHQAALSGSQGADLRVFDLWTRGLALGLLTVLAAAVAYLLLQRLTLRDTIHRLAATAHTLEESIQKADQASRAKSAFLASMSHELRTPLNAILGFSDLMKAQIWGPLGAPQYGEYAVSIHDAGSHLLGLVNDVLDLARIEAGRLQLAEARLAVADCLAEAVHLVGPDAERRRIQVRIDLDGPRAGGMLIADPLRLRQILLNLLGNALKFTPPGGEVTAIARRLRDGRLAIAIRDTGCGMHPEEVATALEPFGQVNHNPLVAREGTGLGLPLSRSLMEVHGGALRLRSRAGRGTTAILLFPRWRVIAAQGAPAE